MRWMFLHSTVNSNTMFYHYKMTFQYYHYLPLADFYYWYLAGLRGLKVSLFTWNFNWNEIIEFGTLTETPGIVESSEAVTARIIHIQKSGWGELWICEVEAYAEGKSQVT